MPEQSTDDHPVRYIWNENYQKYGEWRYNGRTWDFMAWKPVGWHAEQQQQSTSPATPRSRPVPPDSAYGSSTSPAQHAQPRTSNWATAASGQSDAKYHASGVSFPRGEGALIRGHYSAKLGTQPGNLHYEELDPSYYVRERRYFVEGKVFSLMFNETAGETATGYNPSISEVRYVGNRVHTSARRFVVVRVRREFCFACPIFTYSARGTTKDGVRPEEHGIVFSQGQEPTLVPGEKGIVKPSIAVEMGPGERILPVSSRIYYGIHHPVQYNVKVKHIGQVVVNHLPALIGNWKAEDNGETKQSADVTASADDHDDDDEDDMPEILEDPAHDEDFPSRKGLGKMPVEATNPRTSSPDAYLYHPTNNIFGYDKQLNPQVYHPKYNPYGYHPEHNTLGYHPASEPYNYHPDHNPYGYHSKYNPHGYHPKHNTIGYHPSRNPYSYHPTFNPIGYHPSKNVHSFHPTHHPDGYHPQKAPFCWHPQFCPYGYHAQKNPSGFHPQKAGAAGNFHPEVNPLGFHPSHDVYEYHPKHNFYAYHKKHNPSGFHPKYNQYAFHPTHNREAYHPEQNPFGYHPTFFPNSYHPKWQPEGTGYDRNGQVLDHDDSDEEEEEEEDDDDDDAGSNLYEVV